MPESGCVKIKLKPGSLDQVREWAAELNRRKVEVMATLRDEGVSVEAVFLDSGEDGDYLLYYMKAENLAKASEVGRNSTHPIDSYHNTFKKATWDSTRRLEKLVDFDRIKEVE